MTVTSTSDSSLPMAKKCIGSAALPRTRRTNPQAEMGTAVHKHLELRARLGMQAAMAMIDETVDEFDLSEVHASIAKAKCRNCSFEPPRSSGAELALAWAVEGEEAEVVKVRGGQGRYELPEGVGAPGTIDLIYAEPTPLYWEDGQAYCPEDSILHVLDYKTGEDAWVDPIGHNAQLASAAAKAAYWTGARRVLPEILFVENRSTWWDRPEAPWDEDKIDEAMWSTFDIHNRIAEARAARSIPTDQFVEGYYCKFCDALGHCPIKSERVRNLMFLKVDNQEGDLSEQEIARVAAMMPILKELVTWCEELVNARVLEHGPIDVGAGRLYGPKPHSYDSIDPRKMWPILVEVLEDTDAVFEAIKMPKKLIEAAIRTAHARKGIERKKAAAMRQILAMGHKSGAVTKVQSERLGIYIPADNAEEKS